MVMGVTYLDALNNEQKQAVLHAGGPAMVLAGAGSGKTRVLTTRAAHLMLQEGLQPHNIVLLTFTNKAAREMEERVERLTGQRLPFAGTFHRLGARMLRAHGTKIGLPVGFVIYDSDDQLSLVKLICKELGIDPRQYHPKAILAAISEAKQQLLGPGEYSEFARGQFQTTVARVYTVYERRLLQAGAVDFDNLLVKTVQLLRQHEDVRRSYQEQFVHVLIDEYQDTNHAQYVLTQLLAFPQNNVFVVGDASQAIYGWRGADYRNLLQLKRDFANTAEYRLERNYRSTPSILEAASSVIKQNTLHPVLDLWTENTDDHKLTLWECRDGVDEAQKVAAEIMRLSQRGVPLPEMAVLYRTNAQSREFEEVFIRAGITYKLVGGVRFYARKEVKDALALLSFIQNPQDEMAWARIQKLGKRLAAKYQIWAEEVRTKQAEGQSQTSLALLEEALRVTDFRARFDDHDPTDLSRLENVDELLSVASQFPVLADLLEQVALVEGTDVEESHGAGEAVTLMSLHAAKGLEFDVVFLVGMEEGLFPHSRSLLDKEQMEEERRLCYVGITRARKHLYLSHARSRLLYGATQRTVPSRFIREIPATLLQEVRPSGVRKVNVDDPMLDELLAGDIDVATWLRM